MGGILVCETSSYNQPEPYLHNESLMRAMHPSHPDSGSANWAAACPTCRYRDTGDPTRTHIDYRNIAHRRNNRNLKTSPHYGPHLDHRANHTRQRRLQLAAI
jgi:hypothetical protein